MKSIAIALLFAGAVCEAQTDNTFYARTFPGQDVGTKIANAQAACSANAAIPCIIIIDPSLAILPAGAAPSKCAQCSWLDYRHGVPQPSTIQGVFDTGSYASGSSTGGIREAMNA